MAAVLLDTFPTPLTPPSLPDFNSTIKALIARCVGPWEARPSSAELLAALERLYAEAQAVLESEQPSQPPGAAPPPGPSPWTPDSISLGTPGGIALSSRHVSRGMLATRPVLRPAFPASTPLPVRPETQDPGKGAHFSMP